MNLKSRTRHPDPQELQVASEPFTELVRWLNTRRTIDWFIMAVLGASCFLL